MLLLIDCACSAVDCIPEVTTAASALFDAYHAGVEEACADPTAAADTGTCAYTHLLEEGHCDI